MALYALKGIQNAEKFVKILDTGNNDSAIIEAIRISIATQFDAWLKDPDNNRAPGKACLVSAQLLAPYIEENSKKSLFKKNRRFSALEGTNSDTKGCGANMRNPWFGLLPYQDQTIVELSLIQAEISHSHPLAYASAVVTALIVKHATNGDIKPVMGSPEVFNFALSLTRSLQQTTKFHTPEHQPQRKRYIQGLIMLEEYLTEKQKQYNNGLYHNIQDDFCEILGAEGWSAEQALILACYAVDSTYTPEQATKKATETRGDSDSIAAIAGAFVGATMTSKSWDETWFPCLESRYQVELNDTIEYVNSIQ